MKETTASFGQNFVSSDNTSQIICHKLKKCSKIGQDFKNATSNFVCFFTAIVNF